MSNITKQHLAAGLKTLMTKQRLDHITVKELVAHCGVNRQTFYYHFHDIYDLLGYIYTTEALAAIDQNKTYSTWQLGFLSIFNYVEHNRIICVNTYHSLARDHLEMFLHKVTYDLLYGVVTELATQLEADILEQHKAFITKFYTLAFCALLIDWLKSEQKDTPEHLIDQLSTLLEGDMPRAIEKYCRP